MASRSVNKVILIGHLGRDAETKFTPSGVAKTTFTVATSRRWKDSQTNDWKEETDWHNIVLWRSENLANYLQKGKQVYVGGRLSTRSYDDKDGNKRWITEIVADEVILLGGGRRRWWPERPRGRGRLRSTCFHAAQFASPVAAQPGFGIGQFRSRHYR